MTIQAQDARAWSFLTLGESRQFGGNTGYDDLLVAYYSFDSTVPNHASLKIGDLAILRDSERAIGMGWVEELDVAAGEKHRRRCPTCHTTAVKARLEKQPR